MLTHDTPRAPRDPESLEGLPIRTSRTPFFPEEVPDPYARLEMLVARSKRKVVQFSMEFMRRTREGDPVPPLARMLQGGRGGAVRLRLYMTFCLLGVRKPHDVFGAQYIWAEALGLPDYTRKGARRVRDAITWLQKEKLIRVDREKGKYARIYLLSQSGSGEDYARPSSRYANLPVSFWTNGWFLQLSPGSIAILLILLQLQYGKMPTDPPWVRSSWRYGLSADTWTRATNELVGVKLLSKSKVIRGDELEFRRRRNVYWVDQQILEEGPRLLNQA